MTPHSSRDQRFNQLYQDTFSNVYAYCLRRVDQRDDVDDVVAEVYAAVWRRLPDALAADAPIAWVLGVAYRTIGNTRRGRTRRGRLAERLTRNPPAEVPDPGDVVGTADDLARAEAALKSLAPLDQELLRLSLWEELSNPEIAAVLDIDLASLRSKLYRARQRFQEELGASTRDKSTEPDTTQGKTGRDKGTGT